MKPSPWPSLLLGAPLLGCNLVLGAQDLKAGPAPSAANDAGALVEDGGADADAGVGPEGGIDAGADGGTGESATFTMTETCLNGNSPGATLSIAVAGRAVTVERTNSTDGNDADYTGTMSADCKSASGTYTTGLSWTATIAGSTPSASGGCSLGTMWAERESDCVAGWSRDGYPGPSGSSATFLLTEDCPSGDDPTVTLAMTLSGRNLTILSSNSTDGDDPTYSGTMSSNCASASGVHGDAATGWSATIVVGAGTAGASCALGRVWRESANGCVAIWTSQ